jgi:hypothetical protein
MPKDTALRNAINELANHLNRFSEDTIDRRIGSALARILDIVETEPEVDTVETAKSKIMQAADILKRIKEEFKP